MDLPPTDPRRIAAEAGLQMHHGGGSLFPSAASSLLSSADPYLAAARAEQLGLAAGARSSLVDPLLGARDPLLSARDRHLLAASRDPFLGARDPLLLASTSDPLLGLHSSSLGMGLHDPLMLSRMSYLLPSDPMVANRESVLLAHQQAVIADRAALLRQSERATLAAATAAAVGGGTTTGALGGSPQRSALLSSFGAPGPSVGSFSHVMDHGAAVHRPRDQAGISERLAADHTANEIANIVNQQPVTHTTRRSTELKEFLKGVTPNPTLIDVMQRAARSAANHTEPFAYLVDRPLAASFRPGPNTVIIGRKKQYYTSMGNLKLRDIALLCLPAYAKCTKKREKTDIVTGVVELIRDSCGGEGAFVKVDDQGGWCEVSDIIARERVASIFRDFLHDQYRSSSKQKVKRRRERKAAKLMKEAATVGYHGTSHTDQYKGSAGSLLIEDTGSGRSTVTTPTTQEEDPPQAMEAATEKPEEASPKPQQDKGEAGEKAQEDDTPMSDASKEKAEATTAEKAAKLVAPPPATKPPHHQEGVETENRKSGVLSDESKERENEEQSKVAESDCPAGKPEDAVKETIEPNSTPTGSGRSSAENE